MHSATCRNGRTWSTFASHRRVPDCESGARAHEEGRPTAVSGVCLAGEGQARPCNRRQQGSQLHRTAEVAVSGSVMDPLSVGLPGFPEKRGCRAVSADRNRFLYAARCCWAVSLRCCSGRQREKERSMYPVAYLLYIWILGTAAPLTGQYSRGGLNGLVARPLGGYFRLVYLSFLLSSLFWWLFDLYDRSVDRPRPFTV